jgi:hypothetical protein
VCYPDYYGIWHSIKADDAQKGMIKYASSIALSVSWIVFLELSAGSEAWNSF